MTDSTDPNVVLPVLYESIIDAIDKAAATVPAKYQTSNAIQEVRMVSMLKDKLSGTSIQQLLGIAVMLFRFGGNPEKLKHECNAVIQLTNALCKSEDFMMAQTHTHAWMKSYIPDVYEQVLLQSEVSRVAAAITDEVTSGSDQPSA